MTLRTGIFGAVFVLFFLGCALGDATLGGGEGPTLTASAASASSGTGANAGVGGSGGSTGMGGAGGAGGAQGGGADAGMACDQSQPCGDYSQGCTGCAVQGLCAEFYQACLADDACLEFNKCMSGCKDDVMCQQMCADSNMVGAERFNALVKCIVCDVCPTSCVDISSICPK